MVTDSTKNTNLSDLSKVSEQPKGSSRVDWHQLYRKVVDKIITDESKKHTTEIVSYFKNVGPAGFASSLFDILKNLNKIDESKTRLIESIPAYAPCPETNMYYYVTTDGCIVNSRTLQVTELDDSFWDYLKFFHQETGSEGDFSASTS